MNRKHQLIKPAGTVVSTQSNLAVARVGKGKSILLAAAAAAASILGVASATPAHASSLTLTSNDSSVVIDTSAGVQSWKVDGTEEVNQDWFYYHSGNMAGQQSVGTLGLTSSSAYSTTGSGPNNYVKLNYGPTGGLQVSLTYDLNGGQSGSHTADLGETVKLTNSGSSTITLQFYMADNLSLGGPPSGQSATINGNTVIQSNPANSTVSETVVSPHSSEYEAMTDANLINSVESSTHTTTLNDTPIVSDADAAWAFEWDVTLKAGATVVLGIDQQVYSVPEPATSVALLGLGGMALIRPRRRDEDPDPRTAQVAEA